MEKIEKKKGKKEKKKTLMRSEMIQIVA